MRFIEFLKDNPVILDGGMGTLLQQAGLQPGEHPELWCITRPEIVTGIHRAYFEAGSNLVCTNTFGANSLKFEETELEEIVAAAVKNGYCKKDVPVTVSLLGGDLRVIYSDHCVMMEGPAKTVFEGVCDLDKV